LVNGSETTLVVLVFKKKKLFPIFGHLKAKEIRSYLEEQSEKKHKKYKLRLPFKEILINQRSLTMFQDLPGKTPSLPVCFL